MEYTENPYRHASLTTAYIESDRYLEGSLATLRFASTRKRIANSNINIVRKDTLLKVFERNAGEDILLELIASDDLPGIQHLLSSDKYKDSINVHAKDLEGHTIITKALQRKNLDILHLLLEVYGDEINLEDAKLTCVREDLREMLLEVLRYEQERDSRGGRQFTLKALKFKDQKETMTAFMMAAILGKYEYLELLYVKGEDPLPRLHLPSCRCRLCRHTDTRHVENSLARINLLTAMSNPMYNIFMAEVDPEFDPVYEIFMVEKKVRQCLKEEPEYRLHYQDILKTCADLPKHLLDLCRTLEETQIFLSPTQGFKLYDRFYRIPYPRLALAIDLDQKEFVANANIQFVLQTDFVGEPWYPEYAADGLLKNSFIFVSVFFYFLYAPLLMVVYCDNRNSWLAKYLLSPVNRCWSKLGSYLCFCGLLIYLNAHDRSEEHIDSIVRYVRWAVVVFVVTQFLSLMRQLSFDCGKFFSRGWNLFDLLTQAMFAVTFLFWFWDYMAHFEAPKPRRSLDPYDPLLIGECIFALASTFATLRIIRYYILSPKVGPLQTAMGRMAKNLKTIFIYFVWTTLTFALGTRILYRPYKTLREGDKLQPVHITDIETHFLTWFKAGKIGPEQVKLYVPKRSIVDPDTGMEVEKENPQYTTQMFITLICIGFNVIAANFLRSTVTGLFGSTHKAVLLAKDVEWKYLRAQEWLFYIQDSTFSPPFNLIPTGNCINKCCKRDEEATTVAEERIKKYPLLLRKLFQRYLQRFRQKPKVCLKFKSESDFDDDDL